MRSESGIQAADLASPPRAGGDRRPPRKPLAPLCLAVSAGILLDRYFSPPMHVWLLTVVALSVAAVSFFRSFRLTQVLLLALAVAIGGSWRHCCHLFSHDDVGNFAGAESRLCLLRGRVVDGPIRSMASTPADWNDSPRWKIELAVHQIRDRGDWLPASGRLLVHLDGGRPDCHHGDTVEALGWLAEPPLPLNEAEFDYRAFLLSRRIRALLYCNDEQSVRVVTPASGWSPHRLFEWCRDHGEETFQRTLGPDQAPLAEAILIGSRDSLSRSELTAYLESGTMHLLVISGMHLAMVAGGLWFAAGLLGLSPPQRAAGVLLLVWFYTGVTGANPPVVRAAVLISFYLGGYLVRRPAMSLNGLAAAVLVLLACDPSNLFRIGPQLSFLAALAILLFVRKRRKGPSDSLKLHPWRRGAIRVGAVVLDAVLFSATVWVLVSPLILNRFHLLTPASIPLSALLTIPMIAALLSGLALLLVAGVAPLASPLAVICSISLQALQTAVESAEGVPFGSFYAPALPEWWMGGLYLILLGPWLLANKFRVGRGYVALAAGWLIVGGVWSASPPNPGELQYHQIAVGHGNCSVMRFPGGETILYDCGSLKGPEVSERVVAPWLWNRGIRRLDALILSHADMDHFNGVEALARRIPVSGVYVSPHFFRSDEPAVQRLLQFLLEAEIPIHYLWRGDRLGSADCFMRILQPAPNSAHPTDNSASVVALLEHQGVRLLMTGDLEKDGLAHLLSGELDGADILIAPHHGSRGSNTPRMAQWVKAQVVISSEGFRPSLDPPLDCYRLAGAQTLTTEWDGTIHCHWTAEGVRISTFRTGKQFHASPSKRRGWLASEGREPAPPPPD